MSREILLLVDALAHEKNVNKEVVFEALESALASATKKKIQKILMCASKSIAIRANINLLDVGRF